MTDMQAYSFEAPQHELLFDGQSQIGQSRLLEIADDPNRVPSYAQLHLGEVASGAQAVVFYERDDTAGTATLERTDLTDGPHNWHVRTTQMTVDGPRLHEQDDATIATEDRHGLMNRHMFLRPGDTLSTISVKDRTHPKTLGMIVSVHLVEVPRKMQQSAELLPVDSGEAKQFSEAA